MSEKELTISDFDMGYLVGFFDGEGCITLAKRIKRQQLLKSYKVYHDYNLSIRVGSTNKEVLEWIQQRFGGGIYDGTVTGNRKPSWFWIVSKREAVRRLLKMLAPHVLVKRPQVALGLQFLDLPRHAQMGSVREEFRQAMNALNRRGLLDEDAERALALILEDVSQPEAQQSLFHPER